MSEPTALSALLKRYRLAAGYSQEALAERAEISARAISDMERGLRHAPHPDTLERLARALELSPHQRALLVSTARPEVRTDSANPPAPMPQLAQNSVPAPLTPLFGREDERARARDIIHAEGYRLLTLTGPGGVGKTRLCLELAREWMHEFADGAVYIDLSPLRDGSLVPGVTAQALGLPEDSGSSAQEQVLTYLSQRHVLLVFDNAEQVGDAAPWLAEVLARCPRVVMLVTSRTSLHLRGEAILTLAPLHLRDAMMLFKTQAQRVRPDAVYADSAVATVCERLDCLPLAIELAAVHVRTLPVAQLAEHLAQRLPLLRGGMRDLPMRQRTMEDAITWSYELLDESRRRVFRALAVFVGGWTLEAAQVVGWDAPPAQHETTLILADLVDASLVQAEFVAEQVRFRFLEVTHEFALARLRASGDEAACQRRHALWYARLAGVAAPDDSVARSAQLALDVPNIRAAIEWAEAHQDAVIGMQLAGLVRMASIGGRVVEATQWLERMLAVDDQARQHGGVTAPPQLRVERLTGLARGLLNQGRNELARQRAEESLQLAERILDESGISSAYLTQGLIALANGELEEAAHAFTESYVFAGRSGRRDLRTQSLVQLGELARQQGDTERAESLLLEGLEQARMSNEAWSEAIISTLLGRLATQCQDHATACKRYHRALLLLRGFGAAPFIAWCVEGLALTLCAHGETDLAVRLCAAAGTLREQASTPLPINERDQIERMLADARAAIGDDAFAVAWNEGTTMSLDAIVAEGLSASAG